MNRISLLLIFGMLVIFVSRTVGEEKLLGPDTNINPHSKALPQRIIGGILTANGAAMFLIGLGMDANDFFSKSADGQKGVSEFVEKQYWISGLIQMAVGIPLAVSGSRKYESWRRWQQENITLRIGLSHGAFVANVAW
jgi:hypothetical protein